jgi:hypothetical protein
MGTDPMTSSMPWRSRAAGYSRQRTYEPLQPSKPAQSARFDAKLTPNNYEKGRGLTVAGQPSFSLVPGVGVEPQPVFNTRKLLIPESTESLKSPQPTSSGTIPAQSLALDVVGRIPEVAATRMATGSGRSIMRINQTVISADCRLLRLAKLIAFNPQRGLCDKGPYRIVYGMRSSQFGFSRAVTESMQRSAAATDIDLFVLDNEDRPSVALRNAARLCGRMLGVVECLVLVVGPPDQNSAQRAATTRTR